MSATIDVIMELSDRIRELESNKAVDVPDFAWVTRKRKKLQLTMKELGEKSGTNLSLISRIERGKDVTYFAYRKVIICLNELLVAKTIREEQI